MNDPYEGFSVCSDHEVTQAALEKSQWEFVNNYIALCFSLSPNNILMWSHYGEKHKGMWGLRGIVWVKNADFEAPAHASRLPLARALTAAEHRENGMMLKCHPNHHRHL
jgi:hypothetical protein